MLASLHASTEDEAAWLAGTFRLEDGSELPLRQIPKSGQPFAELRGKKSTLLARILAGKGGSSIELLPVTICPGMVDRCRMTLDNTRDL